MCECCNALPDCPSDRAIFENELDLGLIGKDEISGVIWQLNGKCVLNIGLLSHDIEVNIKYCPICGRNLEGDKQDV